jgi:outer membrane protein TolC
MRALRHRPELARMHAMHREAMAMAEVARKERYPELMGSLWANQMIGGPPTMGVMLGVTLPVFGASRAAHRATAFDLRAKGAREDAAAMASMIGFEVTDAVNKLATAEREIELIETMSLPKARESFEASLASYGAGGGHMLDVLDARRALQGSQLGLVEARLRRATAFAELERAVGARVEP